LQHYCRPLIGSDMWQWTIE